MFLFDSIDIAVMLKPASNVGKCVRVSDQSDIWVPVDWRHWKCVKSVLNSQTSH